MSTSQLALARLQLDRNRPEDEPPPHCYSPLWEAAGPSGGEALYVTRSGNWHV